jgi:transposase InsO family protein
MLHRSSRYEEAPSFLDTVTVELWTVCGLAHYRVLFVLKLGTRAVEIAGIAPEPSQSMACNLTDPLEGFLRAARWLIHDRSALFTEPFRLLLRGANVAVLRSPARSPNPNAFAERFVPTVRHECLDRMVFSGEASLCRTIEEFVIHYNQERNHQSLDNKIIRPERP